MKPDERQRRWRQDSQPRLQALHAWMLEHRAQPAKADATARAIDDTLGRWAALVMSLIESAKLCGHDPWAYLRDVLTRLPAWPNRRLQELLPRRWAAPTATSTAASA